MSKRPPARLDPKLQDETSILDENADEQLEDHWSAFFERFSDLDLTDESKIQRIGDPREHLRTMLGD